MSWSTPRHQSHASHDSSRSPPTVSASMREIDNLLVKSLFWFVLAGILNLLPVITSNLESSENNVRNNNPPQAIPSLFASSFNFCNSFTFLICVLTTGPSDTAAGVSSVTRAHTHRLLAWSPAMSAHLVRFYKCAACAACVAVLSYCPGSLFRYA